LAVAPVLSVILALHDVAPYLPTMVAALERNLDVDVELIAIDDASTDATPDLLDAARDRLPLVDPIRTASPVGAATARNLGLDRATGRLITFLDGDDWITPGHLRTLVTAIDDLGCDFVRTDHVQVNARDRQVHRAPGVHGPVLDPRGAILPITRETMVDYPFSWAGVYRADLGDTLRWVDGLHTATDRPWIWQLHRQAASFATIPHAGVYYRRQVRGSLTTIGDERRLHLFDAYDAVLAQVADEPDLQPKAVRQFLGLVARHITMADVYDQEPRRRFDERARAALTALDPDVVERAIMTDDRRELLEPYLHPAEVSA
jgi:glycosyltransferase involved in cell wall biosynthesis